jgi:hypothetical protein
MRDFQPLKASLECGDSSPLSLAATRRGEQSPRPVAGDHPPLTSQR